MSARWMWVAAVLAFAAFAAPDPLLAADPGQQVAAADEEKKGGMVRRKPKPKPAQADEDEPAPKLKPVATEIDGGHADEETHDVPHGEPVMQGATPAKFDRRQFRPDPSYTGEYDPDAQREIYGGKHRIVGAPRPLLELGYPMYHEGLIGESSTWLGRRNPVKQQVLLYGDWRTTVARNDDDIPGGDGETANSLLATRLNLDLDWKFTGTERLHFLFRPLDQKGSFTRYEFEGAATPDGENDEVELNADVVAGFLEGDIGAIAQGVSGSYNNLDLPFAVGLIPILFQNGIWVDDAFSGAAVTVPAMNSPTFDISNMDVTLFVGVDRVSLPGVLGTDDHKGRVLGVATFIETREGYIEAGYGYLMDDRDATFDQSFHSLTAAFTRRYGGWLSNSVRVIGALGQEEPTGGAVDTAKGAVLLIENSLITRLPYTLIPYLNLFVGVDTPQALVRDAGSGGILKNTGLNFETDGLTGFPTLDPTAKKAAGGAIGLEYLFNLNQQVVIELATVQRTGDAPQDSADYGLGIRYQLPFWRRFILRADGMVGVINEGDPALERDLSGVRLELRVKF